jgi:hypothetical protein
MKYEDAKSFCEEKGYTSRASRYEIMEEYFGVSAGTIKDIMSFDRYLRDILPVDEVGIEKEKSWHNTPQIAIFRHESKKLLKEKLLYG